MITVAASAQTESCDSYTMLLMGETPTEIANAFATRLGEELGYVYDWEVEVMPKNLTKRVEREITKRIKAAEAEAE